MVRRAVLLVAAVLLAACSCGPTPTAAQPVVTSPPGAAPAAATTAAAPSTAAGPTPPPTPAPTAATFALRAVAGQPVGGFSVTVSGLDPNESFVLVTSAPGQEQFPRSWVAGVTGTFHLGFDQIGPGGACLIAQRSNGQIARAEVDVAAGSTCASTVAAATPPGGPGGAPSVTDPHDPSQTCPSARAYMSKPTYRVGELTMATLCLPAPAATVAFYEAIAPDRSQIPSWGEAHVVKHGVSFLELGQIASLPVGTGTWQIRFLADGVAYYLSFTVVP